MIIVFKQKGNNKKTIDQLTINIDELYSIIKIILNNKIK